VRLVTKSTGIITTIAGQVGGYGTSGDGGPATSAQLSSINGVAVDASGNVFITDSNKVREVVVSPAAAPLSSPVRSSVTLHEHKQAPV